MAGRKIKVKTADIIEALKKNKKQHQKDYKNAQTAYKKEGLEQVAEIKKKLEDGETNLRLDLVEPIDRSDWYDGKISMFEYEVEKTIELEQSEFDSYVLDKSSEIAMAKMSNSTYAGKW